MNNRGILQKSRRWVVKIGSALLTDEGRGLDLTAMQAWVAQMAELRDQGIDLVLVSSGSVAEGMSRLGLTQRPHALHELQAAAAVGQMGLVHAYEACFQKKGYHTAQILLTHDDLSDRRRYLNARSTLRTLLDLGVVPVVNENDTVASDELRFGDNDTLGALVANLVEADVLVILTDQQGLFDADPRHNPSAELIHEAPVGREDLDTIAGEGGALGRGGMRTKVRASRLAARSGATTVIASGREEDVLLRLRRGERLGTCLWSSQQPLAARKQWLAGQLQVSGRLVLDDGAVRVLRNKGRSLLPVGVCGVEGEFRRGELVACVDGAGNEVARGLVNYGSGDATLIKGLSTDRIESALGYLGEEELIHRDNLIVL